MKYSLFILRRAQKELGRVEEPRRNQIIKAIESLSTQPRPSGCRKLIGREGWKIRVGEYRVIYEIDDIASKVTVLHIGHRKDIYL